MSTFRIRAQPIFFLVYLLSSLFVLSAESFVLLSPSSTHFTMAPRQQPASIDLDGDSSSPRYTVGIIADIQYAPIDDGHSFTGTPRFYRHSLEVTRVAFEHFQQDKVDLVINLGDTIDGKCQDIESHGGDPVPEGQDPGHYSLNHVIEAMAPYQHGRILHIYGNHCLYNMNREALEERLGIQFKQEPCGDLVGYYDHIMGNNIRFVVLDAYDVAIMQRCEVSSNKRREATEILTAKNPNFETNMNSPEGLQGTQRRFVGFNGAVGQRQLSWLKGTLEAARRENQHVVILSHNPIFPDASSAVCLIWNYDEVLDMLREYSDVVVASFSGHAHKGGYSRDPESGIHFRVFEAALENRPEKTYAMVDVHDDRLVVRGFGNCESATYDFSHCKKTIAACSTTSS
jgi:manganese-dependent ADP-ribose/CDP-alcohol diphosphatase